MKKLLLIFLVFSSSLFNLSAQSWLWARQGKTNTQFHPDVNVSIAIDNLHNVYETGKYDGDSLFFQPDFLFPSQGTGYDQAYLIKYDEAGNILWVQGTSTNNNGWGQAKHVTTDNQNNAYITGDFIKTIYFQSHTLVSPPRALLDMFLVKYNPNGNVFWAKQSKCASIYTAAEVSVFGSFTDNVGNTYITGLFTDTVSFDNDTIRTNHNATFLLIKYDSSGNLKWIRHANSVSPHGSSGGISVVTDKAGNIYATGSFSDTISFGSQTLQCGLYDNVFIVKYDTGGNVVWAKQTNAPGNSSGGNGGGICTDIDNNIYISGYFFDTLYIGTTTLINRHNGWYNVFWAKYDNNGNALWAKQAYPLENPPIAWTSWLITSDNDKNLYLAANRNEAVSGNPQQAKIVFGNDTLQVNGAYLASAWVKFDSSGSNVLAGYVFSTGGGALQDQLAVDSSGCYVYFGGMIKDTSLIFNNDTMGINFNTYWPFVARWADGECSAGVNPFKTQDLTVSLYPNPFKDECFIITPKGHNGAPQFSLLDVTGRQMPINIRTDNSFFILKKDQLKEGVYILSIKYSTEVFYKKLVITN